MPRQICPQPSGRLAEYISHRQGDLDPATLRRYRNNLTPWQQWLQDRDSDVERASRADASAYWGTLGRLAPGTRRNCLSQLTHLHNWLLGNGAAQGVNPWIGIRAPRQPQPLPEVIRRSDREALADALGAVPGPKGLRDRALVLLLDSSGARIGEVLGLDMQRLDLRARTARVRGKFSKERVVAFDARAAEALALWLREGRPAWCKSTKGAVFVASDGQRLSYTTVRHMFERGARYADLEAVHIHAHAYRHTFATEMHSAGMPLRALQELLGHASLSSTERYLHVRPEELRVLYDLARRLTNEDPAAAD